MRHLHSFADVSAILGIDRCTYCDAGDHRQGWADPSKGLVHFEERRVTRSSLRHYLKLVGAVIHSHNRGQPVWVQLYEQNTYANDTALQFGIRIPSVLSDEDRARAMDAMRRGKESDEQVNRWIRKRKK